MAKPYGKKVTECPKCQSAIGDEHPYTWCAECGNPLTRDVLIQIPKQAEILDGSEDTLTVSSDSPKKTEMQNNQVTVVGFDMPFWPLVGFLIKLSIAAIPAAIVIAILYSIVAAFFYGLIR